MCSEIVHGIDSYPDGIQVKIKDIQIGSGFRETVDGSKWPNANELAAAFRDYQTIKIRLNDLFKQLSPSDQAGAKEPPKIRKI
jgi:hypothetical protein